MKGWNPFGKVDMEIGSFLEKSPFNKEYGKDEDRPKLNENEKKRAFDEKNSNAKE